MRTCRLFFTLLALLALSMPLQAAEVALVLSKEDPGYLAVAEGFRSAFPGEFDEINLGGSDEKLRQVGKQWEQSPPGLAVVIGDMAAQLAKWYLKDVPIIYCDAAYAGKISLTTEKAVGIYHEPDPMEQLKIMREAFPGKKRVAVLFAPEYAELDRAAISGEAQAMGFDMELAPMKSIKDVPAKVREIMADRDLVWVFTDPVVLNEISIQYIVVQAISSRVPIFCGDRTLAKMGATAALAPDLEDAGAKAAEAALDVLEGSEVSPGARVYPGGRLILSNKMASLMNITFPQSVAGKAVEIVR